VRVATEIRGRVRELTAAFPIYPELAAAAPHAAD
jgi:hypothetical protein